MAVHELEITPKMADILQIFLADADKPRFGLELMRMTGQPSGSMYKNLAKFERHGYLTGGMEDIDPAKEGRPARHFYGLTGEGAMVARKQLAALSERYRPPGSREGQAEARLRRCPVIRLLLGVLGVLAVAAAVNMLTGEIQGRLASLPLGLLWLVARRLPAAKRKEIYEKEWRPELIAQLRDTDSLPITRLIKGIAFAADMIRATSDVAKLQREPAQNVDAHAQVREVRAEAPQPSVVMTARPVLGGSGNIGRTGMWMSTAKADMLRRRSAAQMGAMTRSRTGTCQFSPPWPHQDDGGT